MSIVPFDDRDGWIWLDGQFVPWREAKVHVLTHGLHYASSVFEGERMYGGEIFELNAHTERLFKSAEMLDFEIPFTVAEINEACKQTCAKNGLTDAYVRPIAWRGTEMMAVSAQSTQIHVAIAVWAWPSYFSPDERKKGIRLTWARYRRPAPDTEPVHAKAAGLYMICTISKHVAEKDGYTDAMMLDYRGYIAESTGSNVFFIKDGVIHTPTPDCFLNGITRQTVIKLARARGIEVIERHILPEELSQFSECFVTGSAAEVTPVGQIGEYNFTPGEISLSLADEYSRMVRRELAPA
ncbi:branched-chain amino acid aminotransferase [Phenylobacterium immobile]|uniref:branched-chain amino acid aminotransferase n=1 Tax=Phenylobacterium immobile TaxID=21 RepID=UPI000AA07463|nr:branched-chain amino acid aminotransferase [Phenylobacterium immobile]